MAAVLKPPAQIELEVQLGERESIYQPLQPISQDACAFLKIMW